MSARSADRAVATTSAEQESTGVDRSRQSCLLYLSRVCGPCLYVPGTMVRSCLGCCTDGAVRVCLWRACQPSGLLSSSALKCNIGIGQRLVPRPRSFPGPRTSEIGLSDKLKLQKITLTTVSASQRTYQS
jgi:hypothetical protein